MKEKNEQDFLKIDLTIFKNNISNIEIKEMPYINCRPPPWNPYYDFYKNSSYNCETPQKTVPHTQTKSPTETTYSGTYNAPTYGSKTGGGSVYITDSIYTHYNHSQGRDSGIGSAQRVQSSRYVASNGKWY